MHDLTTATAYPCEGTAALRPQRPTLTLIEGGLSAREGRTPVTSSALLPRQLAAFLASGALVIALAVLASWLSDAAIASAMPAPSALAVEEVVVMPGDTLWGIAEGRAVDGMTTSALVSWIEERNDLAGSTLAPGQRIVVPTGDTTTR